jgi:uncharacterized protein YxjI
MNYPLQLRFKKISLTNQISVRDSNNQEVAYVHQKLFKLKEEIHVYSDQTKNKQIYSIRADRVLDWSPTFTLYDDSQKPIASFKRQGARSLLNATYDLSIGENHTAILTEQNPWVKLLDGVFEALPFIGWFSGYFLNPKYQLKDLQGNLLAILTKHAAFLEGFYTIDGDKIVNQDEKTQQALVMLLMAITMLERDRG